MALFTALGVTKAFGGTLALNGANLTVFAGEVHALLGENGSGKSTLMRVAAGVVPPDSGAMRLGDVAYSPRDPMAARQLGVSMIHQELSICADLSVAENITLGIEPARFGVLRREEIDRIAREALAQVGLENLYLDGRAGDLSVAVRQRIEIARAVASRSRVVIFDEPTSSLTRPDVERLFQVVESLRASGVAVLYISHFLEEVHRIADRVTILRDGETVATGPKADFTDALMVEHMVGRSVEELYPAIPVESGPLVLSTSEGLRLHRGEISGIGGLNGSGRTELLRVIYGLDEDPDLKVEFLNGFDAGRLGMLSENRKEEGLFLNLSILENIVMSGTHKSRLDHKAEEQAATDLIEALRVRCKGPHQAVGELSGGNQQKVALARLIYQGADLLLLDEPTRGVDVGSKQQIYQLLVRLASEQKAILMVSSYLPELLGLCQRISIMREGHLLPSVANADTNAADLLEQAVGSIS